MFLKEVEGTLKMTTFCLLTYCLILPGDAAALFWKTLLLSTITITVKEGCYLRASKRESINKREHKKQHDERLKMLLIISSHFLQRCKDIELRIIE